jgi:hypothetical protein
MPNMEDFAVVVGINKYPAIRPLAAAERDAVQFAEWLGNADGGDLPTDNIRLILSSNFPDPVGSESLKKFWAKPVQADIDAAFIEFGIEEKDRVGRRLYFFFAGHGVAPDFDDVALLMANASRNRLGSNIGVREYRSFLRRAAPFDELVIILDCCREFEDHAVPSRPVFVDRLVADRAYSVQEFYIMAAEYGKKAFEPEKEAGLERRGLLSQALMEALKDHKAALSTNNTITAASVTEYLKKRVPELALKAKLKQKPEIPSVPDMILGQAPVAPLPEKADIQVVIEPALGGEVVLLTNTLQEIERCAADKTPWALKLDPGVYVLTHLPTNQQMVVDARKPQEVQNEYRFK